MADRRYGPRPTPPFISDHWCYSLRSTGEPGVAGIRCPRCGTCSELELAREELPLIGGQPLMIQATCAACSLLGVIVISPPAATRPPSSFLRDRPDRPAGIPVRPPTDPVSPVGSPPVADPPTEGPRRTLAEWVEAGVAPPDLSPSTAAAIPRHSDERPGRRDPDSGRRVYSHAEITAAVALHEQQLGQQHDHDQAGADGGEVQP